MSQIVISSSYILLQISLDGLIQDSGFHLIKFSQIEVQHDAHSAHLVNFVLNDVQFHIGDLG